MHESPFYFQTGSNQVRRSKKKDNDSKEINFKKVDFVTGYNILSALLELVTGEEDWTYGKKGPSTARVSLARTDLLTRDLVQLCA